MNKKSLILIFCALAILAVLVSGYGFQAGIFRGNPQGSPDSAKIQVTASFYPLYYFASQIGGEKAEVFNITPAGAEPHDYEPTAQDMVHLEKSKLVILNGGGLEAWGDNVLKNLNRNTTAIVIAGEGLATGQVEEEGRLVTDPHIWLSPPLAQKMVDRITQGFAQVDPSNGDFYRANATLLKDRLQQLDLAYQAGLKSCATNNIITAHSAFGYLAAAYGLNQVSITGLSPDAEPSAQQLSTIAKFAKDNQVKYIFFESLVSPKLADTIASEVGAKTLVLNPLEGLSDEELAAGKDYLTEMQSNLVNLKIALQCGK